MTLKTAGMLLGILAFSSGLLYAGYWLSKPTIKDLQKTNAELAARDSTRKIELEDGRVLYERTVFDFLKEKELREFVQDSMGRVANILRLEIEADNRTIESLVTANATLRTKIRGVVAVESNDIGFDVGINAEERYEDGIIAIAGNVAVDTTTNPPSGTVDLDVSMNLTPTVSVSRSDDGLAQCDLSFGDMPITVDDLLCVNNLDDLTGTRGSLMSLFGTVGLTGGIAVGLAILVALAAF